MLYNSDIKTLLSQWEKRLDKQSPDYKIGVRDCMYDLKNLIDKELEEETLAHEAFEQQLKEDIGYWESFFDNLTANGMFA